MQTRSGKTLSVQVVERNISKRTAFLTNGMIRSTDDDTPHMCVFCRQKFHLKAKYTVLQCPSCKHVFHESCVMLFIRKSNNDSFQCACCRYPLPVEVIDGIIDTDTLEKSWAFDFPKDESESEDESFGSQSEESDDDSGDSCSVSDDA